MARLIHFILFLLLSFSLFSQNKDMRAVIDVQGRVKEVSVSPDGSIWLVTATGHVYKTTGIKDNWVKGPAFFDDEDDSFGLGNGHFDRVTFFNADTAIITGYISAADGKHKNNGYYYTADAGKTWKLKSFNGDSWIYDVFANDEGHAWMGGSSGEIFYSDDYGQSWNLKDSPYNSFARMHSIYMVNEQYGVSGALHNDIYLTYNNWDTYKKILTPFDQGMYEEKEEYTDDRIEKIRIWGDYLVVNQSGNIFYTKLERIAWKKFPQDIVDFEVNTGGKELFAINDSLQPLLLYTPYDAMLLHKEALDHFPINIKVSNGVLYAYSNDYYVPSSNRVYKVTPETMERNYLYTTEQKLEGLNIVRHGYGITVGADNNHLYLSDDEGINWYREAALDFDIADVFLLNYHELVLWDGRKQNYCYDLSDHSVVPYTHIKPLASFLDYPIQEMIISGGTQGCFHSHETALEYKRDGTELVVGSYFTGNYWNPDSAGFSNSVGISDLQKVLTKVNANPDYMPQLSDFQIMEEDINNFYKKVKEISKEKNYRKILEKEDVEFFMQVPTMLDKVDEELLTKVLSPLESGWSTTSYWFNVRLVNEYQDTLVLSRRYYFGDNPWQLPWLISYQDKNFNCYSVELSRFIDESLPSEFYSKDAFDNSLLLLRIGQVLHSKE